MEIHFPSVPSRMFPPFLEPAVQMPAVVLHPEVPLQLEELLRLAGTVLEVPAVWEEPAHKAVIVPLRMLPWKVTVPTPPRL